jgi:hypothetical protein
MSTLIIGMNDGGPDLGGGIRERSGASCAARCAADARCNAMTFILSQQTCWLKSSSGTRTETPDMVSAVKIQTARGANTVP